MTRRDQLEEPRRPGGLRVVYAKMVEDDRVRVGYDPFDPGADTRDLAVPVADIQSFAVVGESVGRSG